MSRTYRNRFWAKGEYPAWDRDHHCHCLGCHGQTKKEFFLSTGESPVRASDRRRLAAARVALDE